MRELPSLDVGLDLDGCFYDFAAAYFSACLRMGRITGAARTRFKAAERWEFYEDYDHDLSAFLENCSDAADRGLLWSGPVERAGRAAWNALFMEGHLLHVKTDRSFGSHPVASEVGTYMWLGHNGLGHASVTFGVDKTQGPPVDIFLDDKLANYDALDAAGVQVWLMDRPWNQDPGDTRRRVYTHDEFVTRVRVLAAQRAAAGV